MRVWVRLWVLSFVWLVVAAAGAAFAGQTASITHQTDLVSPSHNQMSAVVYGKSLPPIGYVKFCGKGQDECKFNTGKIETLQLTTEKWDQIVQVNSYVQTKIRPVSDMEQYGVADLWSYPTTAGDCEDYVLLKKRYLVGMGFSPDVLLITVVLDENNEGHAVLTIVTNKGDFVLDNRRTQILRWDETGYKFLKRQSQQVATTWDNLQGTQKLVTVSTKSN